jgi:hypothetical protein
VDGLTLLDDGKLLEGLDWRVWLPEGMIGRFTTPAPDSAYDTMAVARGWLADEAPSTTVLVTLPREGRTLRSEARRLAASLIDGEAAGDGVPVEVAGAHGARRLDGEVWMEEGLYPELARERIAQVVAASNHRFVWLTVRSRREDDVQPVIERVIASLEVRDRPA